MYLFQIVIHPLKPFIRNILFVEFPTFKDVADKLSDSVSSKDHIHDLLALRHFIRTIPLKFWNSENRKFWQNNDGFVLIEKLTSV